MKTVYKGFEINVERSGILYFTVMELDTHWPLVDTFEDSSETIREKIKQLKQVVDHYLENPSEYTYEKGINDSEY